MNLTNNDNYDDQPVWSPDGTKIAFVRGATNFGEIFVMNADGSGAHVVVTDVSFTPDWQPTPGPKRSDYKNAAQFCKTEREFLGDSAFTKNYGGRANAYGKCVSTNN